MKDTGKIIPNREQKQFINNRSQIWKIYNQYTISIQMLITFIISISSKVSTNSYVSISINILKFSCLRYFHYIVEKSKNLKH